MGLKIGNSKENPELVELIEMCRKSRSGFWKKIGHELSKSRKMWASVNVSKIDKYVKDSAKVAVPGKVLGTGKLTKKVHVYAFDYSQSAKREIEASGGKAGYLRDLIKENKTGKDVMIIR